MGKDTKIEWAHHTFNPWMGCTKVSEACKFCYAEKYVERWGMAKWGDKGTRQRTVKTTWNKPRAWNALAEKEGTRFRVFCASLADVFEDHPDIKQEWRDDLFALIRETPNLDWLLLTKRPENFERFLPADWGKGYYNVWLGVSAENQKRYDERAPILSSTEASVRFISMEPLLSEVTLELLDWRVDWIIIGGESGFKKDARTLNLNDVLKVMDQCGVFWKLGSNRTKVFFKQFGVQVASKLKLNDNKGGNFDEYPDHLNWIKLRQVPASAICNCGVPVYNHGTCCGWHNASFSTDANGIITDKLHPLFNKHFSLKLNNQ